MEYFGEGTRSPFARAVAAEVRARMAAERVAGRELASRAGFRSHNYLAIRLRDEKPFTLDDVDRICAAFGEDVLTFIRRAIEGHEERYAHEARSIAAEVESVAARRPGRPGSKAD